MANKNPKGSGYKCMFCNFTDNNPSVVNDHQQHHDPITVMMTREELTKLVMYIRSTFMTSENQALITKELFNRLDSASRYRAKSSWD
jgi:hypothetical protein